MLCRAAIPCLINLTNFFFGLETIKGQYEHDVEFNDILLNCKEGRNWKKIHRQ
jgi:hypothetical protein